MGLWDRLRKTGEQGAEPARQGFNRARETWEDAQRRIRRRMRILPRPGASRYVDEAAGGKLTPPAASAEAPGKRESENNLADYKESKRRAA